MTRRIAIPCVTFSRRHRWKDEERNRKTWPGQIFYMIEWVEMDARCIHCRMWRSDVVR